MCCVVSVVCVYSVVCMYCVIDYTSLCTYSFTEEDSDIPLLPRWKYVCLYIISNVYCLSYYQ